MLEIGQLIDNKYKIIHEVGKGGMSHVYLGAEHLLAVCILARAVLVFTC